jgi:hypothetical protein
VRGFFLRPRRSSNEVGRISSHGAARLARTPRSIFLTKLADLGVESEMLATIRVRENAAST